MLCAGATGLVAAMPAQADRIGDARAQAERAWARIQSDGQRLERSSSARTARVCAWRRTESRIRNNQKLLAATRINLAHSEQALSASLISAYKSPLPDPLQAALSARNFGEVLEQFTLLDRTNSYNANMLRAIRVYRGEIVRRQRLLARERTERQATARRAGVAAGAHPQLGDRREAALRGPAAEVRRLLEERRQAEIAASRRAAARVAGRPNAATATVAANDIGGVSAADAAVAAALPAPSSVGAGAVSIALGQLGTPYVPGGAAPGGFDCSGLVSWAYAQAGRPGLPHFTGALWTSGTRVASQRELAPGDLVFFNEPQPRRHVHRRRPVRRGAALGRRRQGRRRWRNRNDYIGAVRISG